MHLVALEMLPCIFPYCLCLKLVKIWRTGDALCLNQTGTDLALGFTFRHLKMQNDWYARKNPLLVLKLRVLGQSYRDLERLLKKKKV